MSRKNILILFALAVPLGVQCSLNTDSQTITEILKTLPSEKGKQAYLQSPYVTAGDRLYMVGYQDGSFPDLGWHVEGEMGGIWNHPIKLMDGFSISVRQENADTVQCLDHASEFTNFPVANQHLFNDDPGLLVRRSQFVPDSIEGIVIELSITNQSEQSKSMEIAFTGMIDLLPVWLSDSLNIEDGMDRVVWDRERQVFQAADQKNPWNVFFGSDHAVDSTWTGKTRCSTERRGRGIDATFSNKLIVDAGQTETIKYFIAGSYQSKEQAWQQYQELRSNPTGLLQNKIKRYKTIRENSDLSIPEKDIQTMYTWLKYNTDWLIRDVPEIGRGISAGIPDYPWWFAADNAYTLQGLLATGRFDLVKSTLKLLYKLTEETNDNGRVIHEASTNGVVFNKGNMNETPHLIYLLWKVYEWTGDEEMLTKYYDQIKKGIDFMLNKQDENGNGYPNGHGMMEIRGLDTEMIDVAVYTQQALWAAAQIAGELDKKDDQKRFQSQATELAAKINREWWVEEFESYADFRATRSQTLELIDDAINRADTLNKPWAVEELENTRRTITTEQKEGINGYVVHHNWVVNTPMEMGIADSAKAVKALATARRYTSRYGMYVTGIDRDERRESSNKWEVFSYVGAVMTLPTGVQAIAEANYGNTEESYNYIKRLSNSFGYALPGSMYEVSPDYGMIVQAWNIYAAAVPIIEHYFGIKPKAHRNSVIIQPDMPASWKNASLEHTRIGDNLLSVYKSTDASTVSYQIQQKIGNWDIEFRIPIENGGSIFVNDKRVDANPVNGLSSIKLTGTSNTVTIRNKAN